MISGENSIPYVSRKYDRDVVKEMQLIEKSKPEDYSIRI
jgi:hypothetical protein